jgi:hypothetical protein
MKMLLFIPGFITGAVLTLSATSHADPLGGGFHRGHHADMAFRTGSGIRRTSAFHPAFPLNQTRRFFRRDRRFVFQPFVWPGYWYPYQDPDDYSSLDYGPNDNYQYWDNSAPTALPESSGPAVDRNPIVVIIKSSDPGLVDSGRNPAYIHAAYSPVDPAGQQKTVVQDPNERIGPRADPETVVPQTPQTVAKGTQTRPKAQPGVFGNFVLVSWLEEDGKDVIYVQNTETNDVQKITSEPNLDNFRIVELHRNPDPKLFEAVISNGSQQGPVRFGF